MSESTTKTLPSLTAQPTPVLSLRDVVVYPHMVIPLFVGRERSILALDKAMDRDKRIVLVTQRGADIDEPAEADLFDVGTLATVLQLLKLPDGTTIPGKKLFGGDDGETGPPAPSRAYVSHPHDDSLYPGASPDSP